uniref:Uncharacterized protein n=1 Tax=Romanomermis culicivorax TaxID=13658 RepID=A0A915IKK4_ROMCU
MKGCQKNPGIVQISGLRSQAEPTAPQRAETLNPKTTPARFCTTHSASFSQPPLPAPSLNFCINV